MRRKYDSMLPSGDSQMQGGNSETGEEKPHTILQVVNKLKELFCGGHKRATLYDQKEYERGVKAVLKGKSLVKSTHEAIEMLIDQQTLLGSIPLDAMRNNSSKLVNQDMDVVPLEEMNLYAECILRQVAENMHDSKLMSRYVEELTKKDREKWQQSQVCYRGQSRGAPHPLDLAHGVVPHCLSSGRQSGTGRLSSPWLLHRQVPPERHHDISLGDGLYADLCHVSHLGHQ